MRYRASDTPQSVSGEQYTLANLKTDLSPNYKERILNNSVRFTFAGQVYIDRDGILYHSVNPATGAGTTAGTINYDTGVVTITSWATGVTNAITLQSLQTEINAQVTEKVTFRTPGAPIRTGSLYVQAVQLDGTQISATSTADGYIQTTDMNGTVDYQTGIVDIRFGQWVDPDGYEGEPWYDEDHIDPESGEIFKPVPVYPDTIRYNCVVYTYLPLDSNILGLDPVRLPFDGKVAIFKKGDVVVIHHTDQIACANPLPGGTDIDCGRTRLARVEVQDSLGTIVDPDLYTENLDTGHVVFDNPLDLTGYTQPLYVHHTVEDMALATDVEINGRISFNKVLSHDFAKDESYISSAMIIGDLYARWTNPFSQQTWTSVWSDTRIGNPITPQYQYNTSPIVVENASCIQQRWALIFTSSTDFNIVGETLGQIGTGTINTSTAPLNPNTGRPYFTLAAAGWGSGWASGNVLRFNTYAANYPGWVDRTVLQSNPTTQRDSFRILVRGDIDA